MARTKRTGRRSLYIIEAGNGQLSVVVLQGTRPERRERVYVSPSLMLIDSA